MKKKLFAALAAFVMAAGAFAQDFPAYLKMSGTVITGCDKSRLPENLVIPDGVTKIGYNAFGVCKSLMSVTIPESAEKISDEAFRKCVTLRNISLPGSVTAIGERAFRDCHNLVVQFGGTKEQWNAKSFTPPIF